MPELIALQINGIIGGKVCLCVDMILNCHITVFKNVAEGPIRSVMFIVIYCQSTSVFLFL